MENRSYVYQQVHYEYVEGRNRLNHIEGYGLNASSYQYDGTGNLIYDEGESMKIEWNALGKVRTVTRPQGELSFGYNPMGQRQVKDIVGRDGKRTEYYLHDAGGNVMCIYEVKGDRLYLKEQPIYGSSRMGVLHVDELLPTDLREGDESVLASGERYGRFMGQRRYELPDHLGNVHVTVSDRKREKGVVDGQMTYQPEVWSSTDYYPFGFPMPARGETSESYRYGFNGQEKDDEVYGKGASYTAEFWQYDARLGRRWNVDPVKHPNLSPYSVFINNPIWYSDPFGADSIQRAQAIQKVQEYVELNSSPSKASYKMGSKGAPGECVDCSGLVSNSVIAGGEPNPNSAVAGGQRKEDGTQSGVLNIEDNSLRVSIEDLQSGNLISFRTGGRYPYHIGIVIDVRSDGNGNTTIEFIHSSSSLGPNKQSFTLGDNSYYDEKVYGYYKWDTKPDISVSNASDMENISNQTSLQSVPIVDERSWIQRKWDNLKISVGDKLSKLIQLPYSF